MKMSLKKRTADIRVTLTIVPIVIALIAGFYFMTEQVILNLSKDKMSFKSENYAEYINTWTERILKELDIYKTALDMEGSVNTHTFALLSTSYGPHDEYPFGLYWGNEYADFYDASGWDPGPEYIPASRNWYIEGLEHDSFAFGDPYVDVRTDRPCVSATVALNYDGTQSVLAADIYFDYVEELIERLSAQEIENTFFVSRRNRMIVANSDAEQTGKTLAETDIALYQGINSLLDNDFTGLGKLKCDETYYVHISRIDSIDWYFITCMRASSMMHNLRHVGIYILLVGVLGCITLIFLANRASKDLSHADRESKTDPLTGLFNRIGFHNSVTAITTNASWQGVMLMFDIDNFKLVNDQLGHPVGDEFLKTFALMLKSYFNRSGDICARLGGDEFAVFVGRKVTSDDVSTMLGLFIKNFHENFDKKYSFQKLSVSIGAAFPDAGSSFDEMYDQADKALYNAKSSGKDRYVITYITS